MAPRREPDCVFCEIIAGRAPHARVGENARAVAFLTHGPIRPGHALVVPRAHAVTLEDVAPEDWAAVGALGLTVAGAQRRALGAEGTSLFLASGDAGEQSVPHLHLHVVPRHRGDGVDLTGWWQMRAAAAMPDELERLARKLRGPGKP